MVGVRVLEVSAVVLVLLLEEGAECQVAATGDESRRRRRWRRRGTARAASEGEGRCGRVAGASGPW